MTEIIKKEVHTFEGHKFILETIKERGKFYLNLTIKKGNKIVDWFEVPLKESENA